MLLLRVEKYYFLLQPKLVVWHKAASRQEWCTILSYISVYCWPCVEVEDNQNNSPQLVHMIKSVAVNKLILVDKFGKTSQNISL